MTHAAMTDSFHSTHSSYSRVPPLPLCLSPSLLSVFHTRSHTVTPLLWSCLCLCLSPRHLPMLCSWLASSVNSGRIWNIAPFERAHQISQSINISLLFCSLFIAFPPSPCCWHSTPAPPPAALVQPCSGGTWGPSGCQGLWDNSPHPWKCLVKHPRAASRGQPF